MCVCVCVCECVCVCVVQFHRRLRIKLFFFCTRTRQQCGGATKGKILNPIFISLLLRLLYWIPFFQPQPRSDRPGVLRRVAGGVRERGVSE